MSFDYFRPHPKPVPKGKKPRKPLPKRSKKNKPATKAEKLHLARVKLLPCICCGKPPPSIAHHITNGTAGRLGHEFTLPLCDMHHKDEQGKGKGYQSIHKDRYGFEEAFGTELELLEKVKKQLTEQIL